MKKKIYTLVLLVIIVDQFIKNIVLTNINLNEIISIIPDFFFFTYVKNTGGAWSIFSNYPFLLTIIGFICIMGLNYYLSKKDKFNKLEIIYYGLILGGMIGNFIDRVIYDGVIDYIGFKFGSYQFPIFNIADITIVIGVLLVLFEIIRSDNNEHRSKSK